MPGYTVHLIWPSGLCGLLAEIIVLALESHFLCLYGRHRPLHYAQSSNILQPVLFIALLLMLVLKINCKVLLLLDSIKRL